ncbi:MAG: rhodanese-like domain-containing protein [Bacillota bacterium]
MRKILIYLLLVLFLIISVGCQSEGRKFQDIDPKTAYERLQHEKNIILLDVRTLEEYNEKHIPQSILIPVDVLKEQAEELLEDKEAPIFVYCRSGNRSAKAAEILVELGYKKVYNLGGINSWQYNTESNSPK